MNDIQNKNESNKKLGNEKKDFQPIRTACDWFGGVTAFAKALNIGAPTVANWASKKQPVPIIRCVQIEEVTAGMVTRKQLRPDDWWLIWPELRGKD
ncbi:transcriptional regulator [Advenella alkanexedens]|uniref:transcriptional regulator n=1 Tax=Advenella alkanexedens TaxID=1481665 RepID=UPI00267514BF|nr:Cro/CI family transcriptional regulator [Advenella alkanexedens]WKU18757.1 Cro/CI family transcriptional regulator [Advenella alkanexedens]